MSTFDISGKQLLNQKADGSTQLDLSIFATGVYILKILKSNGEVKTLKIIKN